EILAPAAKEKRQSRAVLSLRALAPSPLAGPAVRAHSAGPPAPFPVALAGSSQLRLRVPAEFSGRYVGVRRRRGRMHARPGSKPRSRAKIGQPPPPPPSESASRGTDATGVGAPQAPVNTVFEMSNEDLASASIDEGGKVGGECLGPAIDEGLGWALESLSSPLLEAGATTPRHEDIALATVKAFPHQEKYTNTGTFFNETTQRPLKDHSKTADGDHSKTTQRPLNISLPTVLNGSAGTPTIERRQLARRTGRRRGSAGADSLVEGAGGGGFVGGRSPQDCYPPDRNERAGAKGGALEGGRGRRRAQRP
ncbi:hypothetical protein THAOC_32892, partial [Thalassiosira oceanica]